MELFLLVSLVFQLGQMEIQKASTRWTAALQSAVRMLEGFLFWLESVSVVFTDQVNHTLHGTWCSPHLGEKTLNKGTLKAKQSKALYLKQAEDKWILGNVCGKLWVHIVIVCNIYGGSMQRYQDRFRKLHMNVFKNNPGGALKVVL